MKKILVIVFLIAFLFQSSGKLWVLVSFYAQREYIAEKLCVNRFDLLPLCQGQCYLGEQLKENEKKEQNLPDIKQKELQLFCQSNISFQLNKLAIELPATHFHRTLAFSSSTFLFSVFHPPQKG